MGSGEIEKPGKGAAGAEGSVRADESLHGSGAEREPMASLAGSQERSCLASWNREFRRPSDGQARPAIFLDRDGVINPMVLNPATGRLESPLSTADFSFFDGVLESLSILRDEGFPLILVSNQPNYALGKSTLHGMSAIHQKFVYELVRSGIAFARFCYCLHHPKGVTPGYSGLCVCRKPSPWFLLRARDDFGYSLRDSWMIGDRPTDTQCGRAAGARTIRIEPAPGASDPVNPVRALVARADYSVRNLTEAVDIILTERTV